MLKKYFYHGHEMLPPKLDIVFKAIFGVEAGKELLAAFLRDMLDLDIPDGSHLKIINTELVPERESDKLVRLDINVSLATGEQIDVEIQVANEKDTVARTLYYNGKLFTSQLKKGAKYRDLKPVISLIIVDFKLFNDTENWYNKFRIANTKTGEPLTSLQELIFVELPKWKELSPSSEKIVPKERWSLFLSAEREEELDMISNKDDFIDDAIERLMIISSDSKLNNEFNMRWDAEIEYNSRVDRAEEAGMERGFARGIEHGIEQGITRGIMAFIEDNLEEKIPIERIIEKLKRKFDLTQSKAEGYIEQFNLEYS